MTPLEWTVVVFAALALVSGLDVLLGTRRLARSGDLPPWAPPTGAPPPLVSVIVPARNEARAIEGAVRAMLAQDYPAVEFVAVDDRSEDDTGAILDRLAEGEPRLRVVHVRELPAGWLGKNHALHEGAREARGEWLLFADADVVLRPETLGRLLRYAIEQGFDHVAMLPRIVMPGLLLEAFVTGFGVSFNGFMRPWKARDPKSRHFVGIGAFNLVRAARYRAAGGHAPIALRPDDDVKLGKLLKLHGARQDLVLGADAGYVEWYHSFGELVRGMEKNAFAGLEYRPVVVIPACAFHLTMGLGPLAGAALLGGWPRLVCLGMVVGSLLLHAVAARLSGLRLRTAWLYPVFVLCFNYIVLRTMLVNLRDGGIRWRGTFYPLRELRANRV